MEERPRRGWWRRRRPAAAEAGTAVDGWDGVDRRRPRPGPTRDLVSPGLQALFDDLARLDGVVVPGAMWSIVGSEDQHGGAGADVVPLALPLAVEGRAEGPAAAVVDLAEFRVRRLSR